MHEIEKYLENLGFKRNDWKFLTGVVNDTNFTLVHDPITGYTLEYCSATEKFPVVRNVPIGKKVTVEGLKTIMESLV